MTDGGARAGRSRLLPAALLTLVALTLLAEAARLGWLPELAVHFRPYYAAALLVLALVALARGRRRVALLALACLLPHLWWCGPYLLPWLMRGVVVESPAGRPTIVALNLHYRSTAYERVARYLDAASPEVLVLAELTPEWVRALQPVLARYPHALAADRRGPWGLGVFSRVALRDARGTDLGVPDSFHVVATVDWPGGPVRLVAVHLSSPTRPEFADRRNRQLASLAGILAGSGRRVLVGDLNVTPFSPHLRDLLERTGMHDARRSQGLHGTWPRWLPVVQIPIDLCLVDDTFRDARVHRGPDVGSDHYPLEIRLGGNAGGQASYPRGK